MNELDRMVRQLRIAVDRNDFLAATVLRTRIQSYERRQDRITIHSDGSVWNDSLLDRYVANVGRAA